MNQLRRKGRSKRRNSKSVILEGRRALKDNTSGKLVGSNEIHIVRIEKDALRVKCAGGSRSPQRNSPAGAR